MKLCFIGSGTERETTRLDGIEVAAIASVMSGYFDTLVFGGSNVGNHGCVRTRVCGVRRSDYFGGAAMASRHGVSLPGLRADVL